MFEIAVLFVAFISLLIASICDFKSREVPDYLSYTIIIISVALRLVWFLFDGDINIIMWIPVSFSVFFVFSYLMYRAGQWGGGDVKIMMGMSILLSWMPLSKGMPFFLDFFFNSLVVGAVYGVGAIFVIGLINFKKIKKYFSTFDYILIPALFMSIIAIFFLLPLAASLIISLLILSIGLIRYFKIIEENLLKTNVDVSKLTEGDWLISSVTVGKTQVVPRREIGLIKEDLELLQKLKAKGKLRKVGIRIGVPFVPSFFLTLIVTILAGNLLIRMIFLGSGLF